VIPIHGAAISVPYIFLGLKTEGEFNQKRQVIN